MPCHFPPGQSNTLICSFLNNCTLRGVRSSLQSVTCYESHKAGSDLDLEHHVSLSASSPNLQPRRVCLFISPTIHKLCTTRHNNFQTGILQRSIVTRLGQNQPSVFLVPTTNPAKTPTNRQPTTHDFLRRFSRTTPTHSYSHWQCNHGAHREAGYKATILRRLGRGLSLPFLTHSGQNQSPSGTPSSGGSRQS